MATIPVVSIATLHEPANVGDVVFVDAVIQKRHGCAWDSCPENAPCQPCAEFIIVADPPSVAGPRSMLLEIEPESFMIGRMYRFLLTLSPGYRERLGVWTTGGETPAALVVCAGPR